MAVLHITAIGCDWWNPET